MKRLVLCFAALVVIFFMPDQAASQIREKAEGLLNAVIA